MSRGVVNASIVDFGAFSLDFTDTLLGSSNPKVAQTGISLGYGIMNYDYQMGKHEITQSKFDAFSSDVGFAANTYAHTSGANRPANETSWFEAAQFVNWLNTSQGHQAAYDITDSVIDITGSTFNVWDSSVAVNGGTNLYRHKDAVYFMPSEDEWVNAAYWNSTNIQTYAAVGDTVPTQTQTNYNDGNGEAVGRPDYLLDVGSGGEEINGTYDMMVNVWECQEISWDATHSNTEARSFRGGAFYSGSYDLRASIRGSSSYEFSYIWLRVASVLNHVLWHCLV